MDETDDKQQGGAMATVEAVTAEEVRDAVGLLNAAVPHVDPGTPPEVVNRVLGLVMATRNRNDVAAMHNMIVVNLAAYSKKIDALIESTQALVSENIALREEVKELKEIVSGFGEADYEADSVRVARKKQALIKAKRIQPNTK